MTTDLSDAMPAEPTAGQRAYERDVALHPTYHNGQPRPAWERLPDYARESWERNPTAP